MATANETAIFFRNDDVRNSLDNSLIKLTELFIQHQIPILLAVEPANITPEVAGWLLNQKQKYPDIISIAQHGYNHNLQNPGMKMEFGGFRSYEDQYQDISRGKDLMNNYFGDSWSPVFTFPYGSYNSASLQAVSDCGYKILSTKIKYTPKNRIKNFLGKALKKDLIFGKKINYHPDFRNNYKFREISVSVNLIKKYTGYDSADHYSFGEIINQVELARRHTKIIGILMHHRFHNDHLNLIEELLTFLKDAGYRFTDLTDLTN